MTLLKCRQIVRSFGDRQVLNGVNIEINSGDRIGLVGLNGSGKSTLARIITGDLTPDQGAVTVYKKNLKIGYLQQDASYTAGPRQQNCSPEPEENGVFLATAGRIGLKKIPAGEDGMAVTVLSSGDRASWPSPASGLPGGPLNPGRAHQPPGLSRCGTAGGGVAEVQRGGADYLP